MASISRPHRATDLQAGGKIVRHRRTTAPKRTPYERPPRLGPQNPNWLSRLILSPTRMIATGAGKVLSSVFRPDSPSPSSSSSDDDFLSEGETDDDDISSQDAAKLEKNNSLRKHPQAIEGKSEAKCVIEQLLMQETFSREECDRLTHIIKSRVVDSPITEGMDGRLSEVAGRTVGSDIEMPDLRGTVIIEAKKWLEEKKMGSNSKSELEYGTCTLNTVMSPHVEGEKGLPVDLAKSYMQARPPWASPSMSSILLQSPSPRAIQLFKDETSYSFGGNTVSSSKRIRDSSATGSWNILEEIRKVRSKATEDMLRARTSSIIDWSKLDSDTNRSTNSLLAGKAERVSQIAQVGLQNEATPPGPATSIPEQSQDPRATKIIEGAEGLEERLSSGQSLQDMKEASQSGDVDAAAAANGSKDADEDGQPLNSIAGGDTHDSRSHEIYCSTLEGIAGTNGAVAANGFPSSGSSLSLRRHGEQNSKQSDELQNPVNLDHEKMTKHLSTEVTIVNEDGNAAIGSQNSSSSEGLSQDLPRPNLKCKRTDVTVTENKKGGKRRLVKRGKGRAK